MSSTRPPRQKAKATRAQTMLRTVEVLRIRLDGAALWDVTEYVREQEQTDGSPWKSAEGEKPLTERQIARYVQRADALIALSTRESRKRSLRRHLARREALYAKAVNAGDISAALAVLRDDAKLRGLYPPARTQLSGPHGTPLIPPAPERPLTDDERATAVANLLARLGAGRN
jgi:hypothetical protein